MCGGRVQDTTPPKNDTRRIDHIMSLHTKFQPSKSKNTSFISKKRVWSCPRCQAPKINALKTDHMMSLNTKFYPSKSKNAGFISKKRVVGVSYVGATKN